jgi:hypothetical protein
MSLFENFCPKKCPKQVRNNLFEEGAISELLVFLLEGKAGEGR